MADNTGMTEEAATRLRAHLQEQALKLGRVLKFPTVVGNGWVKLCPDHGVRAAGLIVATNDAEMLDLLEAVVMVLKLEIAGDTAPPARPH